MNFLHCRYPPLGLAKWTKNKKVNNFEILKHDGLLLLKVVDSRPARSAGWAKVKLLQKPLIFLVCVTKDIYYHIKF